MFLIEQEKKNHFLTRWILLCLLYGCGGGENPRGMRNRTESLRPGVSPSLGRLFQRAAQETETTRRFLPMLQQTGVLTAGDSTASTSGEVKPGAGTR